MRKRIVLPNDTLNVLLQFGDIDTVVNKILELVEQELIPIDNLPVAKTGCSIDKKVTINITNQWYIETCINMRSVKLKRILQYFVDNELFNEFNWTIVHYKRNDALCALNYAHSYLIDCSRLSEKYRDVILNIAQQVGELCEVMQNERIVQN